MFYSYSVYSRFGNVRFVQYFRINFLVIKVREGGREDEREVEGGGEEKEKFLL